MASSSTHAVRTSRARRTGADRAFVLSIVSLGTGIPITAISAGTSGVPGLLVAWAGIAAVNFAHAWTQRRSG